MSDSKKISENQIQKAKTYTLAPGGKTNVLLEHVTNCDPSIFYALLANNDHAV